MPDDERLIIIENFGLYRIWVNTFDVTHLYLLIMFGLTLLTIVRFGRLAFRLYWRKREAVLDEDIVKGTADPYRLADLALASRSLCRSRTENVIGPEELTDEFSKKKAISLLRRAEIRFSYVWGISNADVTSGKRTSLTLLLLSLTMTLSQSNFGFTNIAAYHDLLYRLFAVGTFLSTLVYFLASFFERALRRRKTCWNYFSSSLKLDLFRK